MKSKNGFEEETESQLVIIGREDSKIRKFKGDIF